MQLMYEMAAELLTAIGRIGNLAVRQNYDAALRQYMSKFLPGYEQVLAQVIGEPEKWKERGIDIDLEAVRDTLSRITEAQEQRDYLLLADYLEFYIKPFLKNILSVLRETEDILGGIDYREKNGLFGMPGNTAKMYQKALKAEGNGWQYQPELTEEGPVTLQARKGKRSFYLHGNSSPWMEGELLAQEYAEDQASSYAVLGLGIGYHAACLWQRTGGAQDVHVYESDPAVIELSYRYMDWIKAAGRNFYIHFDPEYQALSEGLGKGQKLVVHAPSLRLIKNRELYRSFSDYFVKESSSRNQYRYLCSNFTRNSGAGLKQAECRKGDFEGRRVFIVAAGPSLDKNLELLRLREEGSIVLAVGTVLRKLLHMGIEPDYVIVSDANERVVGQIRGLGEAVRPPMFLLSTAHYLFAEEYQGEKYILFQKDFPMAEQYVADHGGMLFETGGSVSTTALDMAIRFRASEIVFLGLDLAFTDNKAHASGTSGMLAADAEDLQPVRGYEGGKVYSDFKFIMYRKWMERRLCEKDAGEIRIINATEGGSYIKGMEHIPLKSVMKGAGGN